MVVVTDVKIGGVGEGCGSATGGDVSAQLVATDHLGHLGSQQVWGVQRLSGSFDSVGNLGAVGQAEDKLDDC